MVTFCVNVLKPNRQFEEYLFSGNYLHEKMDPLSKSQTMFSFHGCSFQNLTGIC